MASATFTVSATNSVGTGSASSPSAITYADPVIAISKGWNLLDLPLVASPAIADATGLISSLTASGQLPSGSITALAIYGNGRFNLFVPGYSPTLRLNASRGVFVLSTRTGTWTPGGTLYTSSTEPQINLVPGWNLVGAPYPLMGLSGSALDTELGSATPGSGCGLPEAAYLNGGSYISYVNHSPSSFQVPATSGMWLECSQGYTWSPS